MSKLKVLLVYPNLQMVNLLPSNIAILSACLKQSGFEVKLFDTTLYKTEEKSIDEIRVEYMQLRPFNLKEKGVEYKKNDIYEDFQKMVKEYGPQVIGVTTTDDTYDLGAALISSIDKKGVHVIFGGVHSTFSPQETIDNPLVDSICLGEGEAALVELCESLRDGKDKTKIKNLWVKENGKVFKNPPRDLADINSLPFEDFSVFEPERLFRPMQGKVFRMIPVSIDRGCPFSCSFCAAPMLRNFYDEHKVKNNYFRVKTLQRTIEEIKYQVATHQADYIYFNSETFFAGKGDILEKFAAEYAEKIGLPFWCQTRIETITKERVSLLKKMGCDRVSIGLEHGNEQFRTKILKKNFTNQQAVAAVKLLNEGGIPVTVNNIIGFPDETRELAFDTIRLNRSISADSINAYFFVPYRGTPLRDYCLKKGYISSESRTDSLMRNSILTMPDFSADEIKGLARTFPLYIKMPEASFEQIRLAEKFDSEGEKMFAALREEYFKKYFK